MTKLRCCMDCDPDIIHTCKKKGCQVINLIKQERKISVTKAQKIVERHTD